MKLSKKMDWKIFAKKVGKYALVTVIAGVLSVWADNPYVIAVAPFLLALENFVKHGLE